MPYHKYDLGYKRSRISAMSWLQRRDIEGVEDMDCLSNMLDVLTAKQGELVMLITGGIDPNWHESLLQIKVMNISSMPR